MIDSTYKAIASQLVWPGQCADAIFTILLLNAYFPLKISWDVSLFRSDTLPFPDQDPAPRAEGYLEHTAYSQNPDLSYCAPTEAILITDTAELGMPVDGFCTRRDSAIITDIFCPGCPAHSPQLTLRGWTGIPAFVVENSLQTSLKIYPNPSAGRLTMYDLPFMIYGIEIYNSMGSKVFQDTNIIDRTAYDIDISDKPNGIYLLIINTDKEQIFKKIIKAS